MKIRYSDESASKSEAIRFSSNKMNVFHLIFDHLPKTRSPFEPIVVPFESDHFSVFWSWTSLSNSPIEAILIEAFVIGQHKEVFSDYNKTFSRVRLIHAAIQWVQFKAPMDSWVFKSCMPLKTATSTKITFMQKQASLTKAVYWISISESVLRIPNAVRIKILRPIRSGYETAGSQKNAVFFGIEKSIQAWSHILFHIFSSLPAFTSAESPMPAHS